VAEIELGKIAMQMLFGAMLIGAAKVDAKSCVAETWLIEVFLERSRTWL
jgi:hypothetical protein